MAETAAAETPTEQPSKKKPASQQCKKCRKQKPAAAFRTDVRNRTGLAGTCKECMAKRERIRRRAGKPAVTAIRKGSRLPYGQGRAQKGQKTCTRCAVTKPIKGNFGVRRTALDGLQQWCKACQSAYGRNRTVTGVNRAKYRAKRSRRGGDLAVVNQALVRATPELVVNNGTTILANGIKASVLLLAKKMRRANMTRFVIDLAGTPSYEVEWNRREAGELPLEE